MMLIPMKVNIEKANVITIWLVTVKLYGIIPIKLQENRNRNTAKITVKYCEPSFLTFSTRTVKYTNS